MPDAGLSTVQQHRAEAVCGAAEQAVMGAQGRFFDPILIGEIQVQLNPFVCAEDLD